MHQCHVMYREAMQACHTGRWHAAGHHRQADMQNQSGNAGLNLQATGVQEPQRWR